jgi:hypothetical protein
MWRRIERITLNKYTELRDHLTDLKAKRPSLGAHGNGVLIAGGLAFGLSLSFLFLIWTEETRDIGTRLLWFSVTISVSILAVGIARKLVVRSKLKKQLDAAIDGVRMELKPLEKRRGELLKRIRRGDLAALESFADYVYQGRPLALYPSRGDVRFPLRKGETCFIQVADMSLGRFESRIEIQRTEGFQSGEIYVPAQSRQVIITEMKILDVGTLAITDRHIFYSGTVEGLKLAEKLSDIEQFEVHMGELRIMRKGEQDAEYFLETDAKLLDAILQGIEANS